MKNRFLLIVLIVFLVLPGAAQASAFCVQHFNAYGPVYATQVKSRTEKFVAELMAEAPLCDVVQLIEVWTKSQTHQIIDRMSGKYSINTPNLIARNGLMSLVHGEIEGNNTFDFAINKSAGTLERLRDLANVKKSFHVTKVQLVQLAEPIYFVNTHLHPTSQAIRLAQIIDLFQWRLENKDIKMILSGDFNADKDSVERSLLLSLLAAHDSLEESMGVYPTEFCTYCEENPRAWLKGHHVLDYIFYSNISNSPTKLRVLSGQINLKGTAKESLSDHYGVRVQFDLEMQMFTQSNSYSEVQTRNDFILKSLMQSREVLKNSLSEVYEPYVKLLLEISNQVEIRRGPYWDYIRQYH